MFALVIEEKKVILKLNSNDLLRFCANSEPVKN